MKRRFFLIIMTLVLVLTLGACSLESKKVELGVSASFKHEMVEGTSQKVEIEIADSTVDLEELVITWESSNPEIAEVTQDGLVKANKPGQVTIEVNVTTEEASKELALEITVVELVYTIEYELNGGQNSELNPAGFANSDVPVELYPATKLGYKFLGWEYEGEIVEEIQEARNVKLVAKWELEEYSISYDVAGGEYEGEAVESYTVNDSVVFPVPTKEGYEFKGWYAGEELVEEIAAGSTGNLELVAKWEVVEYAINYDLDGGKFEEGAEVEESYSIEDAVKFAVPVKEGYRFLGWYAGEELVEGIEKGSTGEVSVVAKWEAGYYIEFDADGGELPLYATFDEFMDAFFAEYVAVCQAEQSATITKDTFHSNSHPSIKTFFGDAERLAKYHWLIAYIDAELREYNAGKLGVGYVADTLTMLELMLAGDTAAISASGYGPNGRTLLRNFIHGMLNHNTGSASAYIPYTPDFSSEAQCAEVVAAPGAPFLQEFYQVGAELPVPTKEGYIFEGWYSEKGELVETATVSGTLTAHWRDYYVIDFDLNGGEWEGLLASFEEIGEAYLADFNSYGNASLTKQNYFGNSTAGIKASFGNAEMLAKWNWLLVYMLEDLIAYNTENGKIGDSYVKDAIGTYIPQMIAGDTTAINCNDGGNTRTLVRAYLAGVMNAKKGSTDQDKHNAVFTAYVPDFSLEENQKALYAAYLEAHTPSKVQIGAELPKPVKGTLKFLGWANEAGEIVAVAEGDGKLVAQWETAEVKSEVKFDLAGGLFAEGVEVPTEYVEGKGLETLPTPEKEGYAFLGWYLNGELVESISKEQEGAVELVAEWKELSTEVVLNVGPNAEYKTLAEALLVAQDGAIIKVAAGTYEGVEITKSITIEGANAGINPNRGTRVAETIIVSDMMITADNVVIDGIQLSEKGRIFGNTAGLENLVVRNVSVIASTVNPDSSASAIAPLDFFTSVEGAVFKNLVFAGLKYAESTGRPMIFHGAQIDGLEISDSHFVCGAGKGTYTDGIKISDAAAFGVRGDVKIVSNYFEGYGQYTIWVMEYQEGNYYIADNTLYNCGQVSYHATRFDAYNGAADGKLNIEFVYNTVDTSYELFRMNASTSLPEENVSIKVNYNKLIDCGSALYVENRSKHTIDATNNWYNIAPVASNFQYSGGGTVNWNPYYTKESDVPVYVDKENSIAIKYELDGGVNPSDAPEFYNKNLGLGALPTPNHVGREFLGWYYNGEKVEKLEAGLEVEEIVLVAKWRDRGLYVGANETYKTIAEAMDAVKSGEKIILTAGTYAENVTISKEYVTLQSAGDGEAILTGTVTISAKGATLNGLSFTGNALVRGAQVIDFRFTNNKVYDTTETTVAWAESNAYKTGFIYINSGSSSSPSQNITVANNTFENVSGANVFFYYVENISIEGNVFKNFDHDAIRFDGGTVGGQISITNNEFAQDTLGGYNGVYFRMYGDATNPYATVYVAIKGNKFVNIGNAEAGLYSGAIGARNYQEYGASFEISGNYFEKCYNYIRLRNNATAANHAAYAWACEVENNIFVGLPTEYYFASWNASGAESTDPIKTVFGANYYEDNDGKAITDLSAHQDKFKQVANIGTAIAAKPELAKAETYKIYRISYDLAGGSTLESFVYNYDSLTTEAVKLPTLSKPNHNFLGWYVGDEKIEEITADTAKDLALVAKWQAFEGDFYDIEFETNGHGNWPTRDAISREEIYAEFYKDMYEWAKGNGETADFETYKTNLFNKLSKYENIYLRNSEVGFYADETGSTEYFLNTQAYFDKWVEFFKVFDAAMLAVNAQQSFMGDNYAVMVRMYQFLAWNTTGQGYYTSYLPKMYKALQLEKEIPNTYQGGQILELPVLTSPIGREFLGWYDNPEFTGEPVTSIVSTDTGNKKFYAKWEAEVIPTTVEVNKIDRIKKYEVFQFVWTLGPENAQNKEVEFFSSNPEVASITNFGGKLTAHKDGKTTITMKVYGNREIDVVFEVEVYSPAHIEGGFESSSFVAVGNTIELFGKVVGATDTVKWSSLDESIATVDQNGVVTGVKAGTVKIVAEAANDATVKLEYFVTVLDGEQDEIVDFILAQHNANIFTFYDMVVGGDYSIDIYSSISKLFYNHELYINTEYVDDGDNRGNLYENSNAEEQYGGLQFITFHYTGTMGKGADADNIVKSMTGASSSVSIHFATGNMANGNYTSGQVSDVYQALSLNHGAWHAGDSNARYYSNSTLLDADGKKRFQWIPTGVPYDGADLLHLDWSASDDFYFEINGKKTTIKLPETYDYNSRKTNHTYNADGTISSSQGYGQTAFTGRTPESFFNSQGFVATVIDGYYYMCPTWWSYGQVYEGRICAVGGNLNSIGIESCVDKGSDLWYTWQTSAQLVAKLLDDNDLTIDRVKGHHFFDGKNCPQPMLENDLEIWWEFIDLVKAELELRQKYSEYKITMVSNNPDIVDNHGRVVNVPEFATSVTYTVTIEKDGQVVDTVTLGSIVPGIYEK